MLTRIKDTFVGNKILKIFIFLTCFFTVAQTIFASCENLCCKNILCIIEKAEINDELVNLKHGKNCIVLDTILASKIRYVVNPNYIEILENLRNCVICGGENLEIGDKTCQAYCCQKEGYILDKKYRILHSLSCDLLANHYDINWCIFKKKTYRVFALKEVEFAKACDKCLVHEKRLQ